MNQKYSYSSQRRGTRPSFTRSFKPNRRSGPGKAYINPEKFINTAKPLIPENSAPSTARFSDFPLSPQVRKNLDDRGYTTPTPIQIGTISAGMEGKDIIGLANTGSGKTAAFLLPIIERITAKNAHAALIMCPTRELAVQIYDEFRIFAKGMPMTAAICVGGVGMEPQIRALRNRPQFIIGTPGRLKDLHQRHALNLSVCDVLVLDEADRMLDMGFIADIRHLVSQMPAKRQSLCFSATITPAIERLLQDFLTDPVTVSVRSAVTADHINQDIVHTPTKEEKFSILTDMLAKPEFEKVLIFGETKFGVQRLADQLTKLGLKAQAIHGNKSQPQRQRALKAFASNQVNILVATDVAARGLDIPNVSHVINFDTPQTYEDYVHRIGRTGRAGKSGQAYTFVERMPARHQSR
ncbi:DEAD/DEAH box helicase [Candidatus Saccharibacteria bacterium]|nr:DEAD/DEAH box helicase [Candidatus Saccharibacteria bacterium]